MSKVSALVFGGLIALGLSGCPGAGGVHGAAGPYGTTPDGKPRWIHQTSGAYSAGKYGKAFYGVGLVAGIQNEALARQTAGNRARGEIAKIFDLYVAAMMKDYQRSTTAGTFKSSAEEQDVVSAQKTVTETTVRGIEVRDFWRDPQDGTLYALAVLEYQGLEKNIAGLPVKTQQTVRRNAERAFADLDKELAKRSRRAEAAPATPPVAAPAPAPEATPEPPAATPPAAAPEPAPATPKRKPRVGLKIVGNAARHIQTCLAGEVLKAGYELWETSNDVDLMIRGSLAYQRAGNNNGLSMVKVTFDIRVLDMANGKTRAAVNEQQKIGRPTVQEAVQSAVTKLCRLTVPRVMRELKSGL